MATVSLNDVYAALPFIVLSLGSFLIMLAEVAFKKWPKGLVTLVILVLALASLKLTSAVVPGAEGTVFSGILYADRFTNYIVALLIGGTILSVLMSLRRLGSEHISQTGEYYALLLMATAGAVVLVSSAEFITFFLGLELMSMALYCMCGAAIDLKRSSESALKYFLLGSFSSAFLLYGIALLYGLTGSMSIVEIGHSLSSVNQLMAFFALGLVLVGLVFKIGAVPFHFWAPDVYQGAPTPVTAYMACVIKAAAVAATMRVLWVAFQDFHAYWFGAVWLIAVLTMVAGNLMALRQRSIKRMLAYSSIAHAGYLMVAFLVPSSSIGGGAAALYYLVAYTVMTLGAFAVVLAVSSENSSNESSDDIARFNGLGYSRPLLGAFMALFMLSLAGIPPGMAGLVGKVYIFGAAIKADFVGLAVIGIVCSAISCYYYLRVIVAMYFVESPEIEESENSFDFGLGSALGVCALAVVLLGIFPGWLYTEAAEIVVSAFPLR